MTKYKIGAALLIAALSASQAPAASKNEIKMLKGVAECAYVVMVAEQNGVRLQGSSAVWNDYLSQASQKLGVDTTPYIREARAKYESRSRKMGAQDTLRKMISNAQECDSGLNS